MRKLQWNWTVAGFFIFYFVVLQFLSDWQYRSYVNDGNIRETLYYRLFSIPFIILLYYLYYRLQVPLLLKKKYVWFFLSIPVFIVFLEFYFHLVGWVMWHAPLQTDAVRKRAEEGWKHFDFPSQSFHLTLTNLFAVTGFGYFIGKWKDERMIRQLKEQQLELELNYLKAQLHPHFFFNTMNNIYSLALYRSEKTAPVVEKLSGMMRYIIYEGKKDKVPLSEEIAFLKNFAELERIRHEDETGISFMVQGDAEGIFIPPLLFMPLLENSFKHGLNGTGKRWVEAAMLIENNEITLDIKNSSPAKSDEAPGIGLENLGKRLELLYPGKYKLATHKKNNQFEVNLTLKLA